MRWRRGSKKKRKRRDPARVRVAGMLVLYLGIFGLVIWRLTVVQVVHAEEYADRGEQQRAREIELSARRGRLYDRDGDILATSIDAATIYADPRAYQPGRTPQGVPVPPAAEAAVVAKRLAPLVDRDPAELADVLRSDRHFVYVARQVDWEVGEQIRALDLPGVGVLTEPARVYPAGSLAGQIVGFTGIDGNGLLGLELQHDRLLTGQPGRLVLERAPGGLAIASGTRQLQPAVAGTDLVLTIDRDIQYVAEQAAQQAMDEFHAAGAGVVVLEVETGDVLAMASMPGFDPNDVDGAAPERWRNRTVTDVFEPGSVQKAITAAAALEEGIVTPSSTFLVDDSIRVGNKTFSDAHDHAPEEMTFQQIIESSSNVGTIMVAQQLGEERLASYLDAFGYGRRLGVGFPGESPGLIMPVEEWWTTSLPTIAIGQGVATTLLQTASFYATIANDGVATQPRILRGTVGEDGRLTPTSDPQQRRVISDRTSTELREILATVVDGDHGTGSRAAVPGYRAAGKTGTARKPNVDARGYSGEYVASFVGFAPVDDPQIVVAVMLDEPRPIWGGVVAAPVFSEVMEYTLKHRRVPPTEPTGSIMAALDEADRQRSIAAAQAEGPATPADEPGSPPVGTPAGGDGTSVQDPAAAPDATGNGEPSPSG